MKNTIKELDKDYISVQMSKSELIILLNGMNNSVGMFSDKFTEDQIEEMKSVWDTMYSSYTNDLDEKDTAERVKQVVVKFGLIAVNALNIRH
mgnify:CR=1 FL=1